MQYNRIPNIEPFIFSSLIRLEFMDLSYNRIEVVLQGTFDGLNNIRVLKLQGNIIMTIEHGVFSDLHQLQKLFITGSETVSFPLGMHVWQYKNTKSTHNVSLQVLLQCSSTWRRSVLATTR